MPQVIFALLLLFWLSAPLAAQGIVTTSPLPTPSATGSNASSSVTSTNTFQSVFSAVTTSRGRVMCLVQNNGAAAMFVFVGAPTSGTTPTSIQLNTRETFTCDRPGGTVLQDQISITGTSGQQFFAIQR